MGKYSDKGTLGRSKIAPFKGAESSSERHARRLEVNLQNEVDARDWCQRNHVRLIVRNDGHHWQFKTEAAQADWWPSSAKLVVDQKWDRGIHAHDWVQVTRHLAKRWRLVAP